MQLRCLLVSLHNNQLPFYLLVECFKAAHATLSAALVAVGTLSLTKH